MDTRAHLNLAGMLAVCAGLLIVAVGCREPTPAPTSGEESLLTSPPKELVLSIPRTPDRLNPLNGDEVAVRLHPFLFQGLTRLDGKTGSPVPALATSWEVGQGGREYVFQLPTDLQWSDGRPFGPEDVVFTLQDLIHAEAYPNPYRSLLQFPGGDEPIYPTTEMWSNGSVRITLPEPYPPLLRALAQIPILPRHRLRQGYLSGQIALAWHVTDPQTRVTGTGPYALDRVEPGVAVYLRRNPYYGRRGPGGERLPRIDRITFRVLRKDTPEALPESQREPKDPLEAFLQGEIDLLVPTDAQASEVRHRARRGSRIVIHEPGPTPESTFITFRHGKSGMHAVFADRRFRVAMSHAIDRRRMVDGIFGGYARAQWSPISPAHPAFHDPDVTRYEPDKEKARGILDGMGIIDRNMNGVRQTPDGLPLHIEILTRASARTPPHTRRIADAIVGDLARIGIRATVRPRGDEEIMRALFSGDWDAFLHTSPEELDPYLLGGIWRSNRPMHYWSPRQSKPSSEWEAEIDRLFEADSRRVTDEERRAPYHRLQQIAARELPIIYTVQRVPIVAVLGRVRHFAPSPVGLFHNIDLLDLEP